MPFLAYLPGDLFKLKEMQRTVARIQSDLRVRMEERKAQSSASDEPQDFVDAYLKALYKRTRRTQIPRSLVSMYMTSYADDGSAIEMFVNYFVFLHIPSFHSLFPPVS